MSCWCFIVFIAVTLAGWRFRVESQAKNPHLYFIRDPESCVSNTDEPDCKFFSLWREIFHSFQYLYQYQSERHRSIRLKALKYVPLLWNWSIVVLQRCPGLQIIFSRCKGACMFVKTRAKNHIITKVGLKPPLSYPSWEAGRPPTHTPLSCPSQDVVCRLWCSTSCASTPNTSCPWAPALINRKISVCGGLALQELMWIPVTGIQLQWKFNA